jgi:hypothetical protein
MYQGFNILLQQRGGKINSKKGVLFTNLDSNRVKFRYNYNLQEYMCVNITVI